MLNGSAGALKASHRSAKSRREKWFVYVVQKVPRPSSAEQLPRCILHSCLVVGMLMFAVFYARFDSSTSLALLTRTVVRSIPPIIRCRDSSSTTVSLSSVPLTQRLGYCTKC